MNNCRNGWWIPATSNKGPAIWKGETQTQKKFAKFKNENHFSKTKKAFLVKPKVFFSLTIILVTPNTKKALVWKYLLACTHSFLLQVPKGPERKEKWMFLYTYSLVNKASNDTWLASNGQKSGGKAIISCIK